MKAKKILLGTVLLFGIGMYFSSSTSVLASSENNMEVDVQSQIDYGYEDILLAEIIEFEKTNPTATTDEIDAHFLELAKKYNRNNKDLNIEPQDSTNITPLAQVYNDTNYIYEIVGGQCNLNSLEQTLFNNNPTKGFKACVAGKEAQDYTLTKFGFNGHNDKTDAFRHGAWNIYIVGFTDDITFAATWTAAHEDGASNQPKIEYDMDTNNNMYGRLKAKSANISTSSSVTSVRNAIEELYKSGNLVYILNNKLTYFAG
jgi:hypothetical protein